MASSQKILIRPGKKEDLPEVLRIEAAWPTTPHWSQSHFEKEITGDRNYFCVLEHGGRIVGYGGLILIPPEAQVSTLAVHPEFARQGMGRKLMEHLHQRARQTRCALVTLEVSEKNPAAIRLYESFGYRIVGRRRNYYNGNADALLMTNHLAGPDSL